MDVRFCMRELLQLKRTTKDSGRERVLSGRLFSFLLVHPWSQQQQGKRVGNGAKAVCRTLL